MWQALPFCMLALMVAGMARRDMYLAVTPAILLYDWALCSGYVLLCNDSYPWVAFAIFDGLAGLAIAMICVSNWQRILITTYAAELICHASFGLSSQSPTAVYNTYYILLYTAWLQVAIQTGWVIHDFGNSWWNRHGGGRPTPPSVEKSR